MFLLFNKRNKEDKEYKKLINKEKKYDELTKIVYNSSGDMNGNIDCHEFDIKNLEIITEYRQEMGEDIKETKYKITEDNINTIKDYINKYNFPMWDNLEFDENEFILDGPSTSIVFYYNNEKIDGRFFETYSINHNYKMPEMARKNLNEFEKYLFSLEIEENIIKERYKKDID